MKKLIAVSLTLIALTVSAVKASDANNTEKVQQFTDQMAAKLQLDDSQRSSVQSLNEDIFKQLQEVKAKGKSNRREQFKVLRSIGEQRKEAMKKILNDEQFEIYQKDAQERREKFKAMLQDRKK